MGRGKMSLKPPEEPGQAPSLSKERVRLARGTEVPPMDVT